MLFNRLSLFCKGNISYTHKFFMHTMCTPTSKCHEKFYKKNGHLLLFVLHISTKSHIQISYILAVTKKNDSFKGKNLLKFYLFYYGKNIINLKIKFHM